MRLCAAASVLAKFVVCCVLAIFTTAFRGPRRSFFLGNKSVSSKGVAGAEGRPSLTWRNSPFLTLLFSCFLLPELAAQIYLGYYVPRWPAMDRQGHL